jgi:hypothetical protein
MLNIPLTIVPLVIFNLFGIGLLPVAGDPWTMPILTTQMLSGARFTLTTGDLLVLAGIVFLALEVIKATRIGDHALPDHLFSMVVFVVYLVEFITLPFAAHPVFFTLTVIAFVDVVAGFSVTVRAARRDIAVDRDNHP